MRYRKKLVSPGIRVLLFDLLPSLSATLALNESAGRAKSRRCQWQRVPSCGRVRRNRLILQSAAVAKYFMNTFERDIPKS